MAKIFIIGPAYPLRGGLATFDELFCTAFNEQGHDCEKQDFPIKQTPPHNRDWRLPKGPS